jgi:hypothetical protein
MGPKAGLNSHEQSRPIPEPTGIPIQWVLGAFSTGVKRPECEAYHSSSTTEFKKTWIYTPCPPYAFMV